VANIYGNKGAVGKYIKLLVKQFVPFVNPVEVVDKPADI
jgi:hypothetical protein